MDCGYVSEPGGAYLTGGESVIGGNEVEHEFVEFWE